MICSMTPRLFHMRLEGNARPQPAIFISCIRYAAFTVVASKKKTPLPGHDQGGFFRCEVVTRNGIEGFNDGVNCSVL